MEWQREITEGKEAFAEFICHKLNSFFEKSNHLRYTRRSPDGKTFDEINTSFLTLNTGKEYYNRGVST